MEQIFYILIGIAVTYFLDRIFRKDEYQMYDDGYEVGFMDGISEEFAEQDVICQSNVIVAKKVVANVIDDKLNALKEEYHVDNREFSLPVRLDIMKLENIKDEICVALDDEFSPEQRA